MPKSLIVIESPNKIPAYKKYLGADYDIVASFGHVVDLPLSKKDGGSGGVGVDLKNDFKPTYEVIPDKKQVVKDIVDRAKKADTVYLMSDPDREGTAIAYHLSRQMPPGVNYKRASTASITKGAILDALAKAGEIDLHMVDAYEARRILDRLVGYMCSYITKQATGGPSAGRVQSAALRILAEREQEIRHFIPVEHWPVNANLVTPGNRQVVALVVDPDKMDTKTEGDAKAIEAQIRKGPVLVETYDVKTVSRNPWPPFTTSSLQATASSMFGWSQKQTMSTAQKLYEQGHITYMRTDSTHVVPEVVASVRSGISSRFGANYVPEKPVFYRGGKNAQEAHEAVRPTHLDAESVGTGNENRLYKLIWKRTFASQMKPELREQVRATFSAGGKVVLASSGGRQVFDGWKRCWDYSEADDSFLPEMKVGDPMGVAGVAYEQKFTDPPPRYGVASFNKKLEEMGMARPSTLASLTETLKDRKYVNVEKNSFHVTDLGVRVVEFLVSADFCFADPNFTKQMEDDLDDILESKKNKLQVLGDFWKRLKSDIDKAKASKSEAEASDHECPKCAAAGETKHLVKKFSRFGEFYSCENHKVCGYKADVGEDGMPKEKVARPKPTPSGFKCPKCGKDLVERKGFSTFLGCVGYPTCSVVCNLDGTEKQKSPKKGKFFKRRKNK